MASSLNRVMLIGNLGRDPEIRATKSSDRVANFTIATSESWKDKATGERKVATEWHRVCVWGALVDVVEKRLKKGTRVFIAGKLQTREWEKDGQKQFSTEIVLQGFGSDLITLDEKTERQDGAAPVSHPFSAPPSPSPANAPQRNPNDDEIHW